MAIEREVWLGHIIDNLFSDNSPITKSIDLTAFVQGKTCHIPNAGLLPGVVQNRIEFPGTVKKRADTVSSFSLISFTTDPMLIPDNEQVQLSYDKRESVLSASKMQLQEAITDAILKQWLAEKGTDINTSGAATPAHTPSATGNRKKLTRQDIRAAMTQMNKDNVPSGDRYLLLDAEMYDQLMEDLSETDKRMFDASANAQSGVLGNLFGFSIMMRAKVGVAATGGAQKELSAAGAATDLATALAWHKGSVCRANGEPKAFMSEKDPQYYGDIMSFEALAAGSKYRGDKKGIIRIIQATTA